jgi:flavin reductase (DIM6/NTAB) family NADH-FMN oxidoreductase RutF
MSDNSQSDAVPNSDTIGPVLGRTPSGVFILTVSDGAGRETGMLTSWVQQASFDPPAITVAVNSKRYINDWLQQSPQVALNLVGESQSVFLKHFGRGFEADQPAFEGLQTSKAANGATVLDDVLGYLAGEVTRQMEAGDHVIYLVRITTAGSGDQLESNNPMVHIRKNGFKY